MPAPSKNFTYIADTAVAPDAPMDTILATAWRDNDINLREWIGGSYTPAVDHNHDGVNSTLLPGNVAASMYYYHNFY